MADLLDTTTLIAAKPQGQPFGTHDRWIAAHSCLQAVGRVTDNLRKFQRGKASGLENRLLEADSRM